MFEDDQDTYRQDYELYESILQEIDEKREAIVYFEKFFILTPRGIEDLIASAPAIPKKKCSTISTETKSDIDKLKISIGKLTSENERLKEAKRQADDTITKLHIKQGLTLKILKVRKKVP